MVVRGQLRTRPGATDEQLNLIDGGLTTGLLTPGFLTVNAGNPALFDLSAGVGRFVDNTTDPLNPVLTELSFGPFTGVTITNLVTQGFTFMAVDINGDIIQQVGPVNFNQEQRRDLILIGVVGHQNFTTINAITNVPLTAYDIGMTLNDLTVAVAGINTSGNIFSPNGVNLNIDKSSGTSFSIGNNFSTNPKDPNSFSDPQQIALTFNYFFSTGFIFDITDINGDIWDDFAGPPAATVPNNRFTIQRITYFGGTAGNTFIQLGQNIFMTIDDALQGIQTAPFIDFGLTGAFRGWLVIGQGTTDLTDPASAQFVNANKFGF